MPDPYRLALLLTSCTVALALSAQTITLYENQFITPNVPAISSCGVDLVITPVNDLWAGTGGGTGGGGLWAQIFTVETLLINGPGDVYADPSGIGGDYCLGMLSAVQDDRAALTLDRDNLPFVNLMMDISPIDVSDCGGPFGLAVPKLRVVVYDSPGGVFNISSPGTILAEDTLIGLAPLADPYEFNWTTVVTGLDVSGATENFVTIFFDLIESGYVGLDNIMITASVLPLGNEQLNRAEPLSLFPVPATDRLFIRGMPSDGRWSILAVDGSSVMESSGMANDIDITKLNAGCYVLQWTGHKGKTTVRFVKDQR